MIFDCFSFMNELDLLEVRLHELSDVVDYFVLSEATRTHSGIYKPLYYKMNKRRFQKFNDKIIHIIVEDMPMTREELDLCITGKDKKWIESKYQVEDNWVRERFQRNALMRGLQNCNPEDIIIIGDADEIVRRSIVSTIKSTIVEGSNAVEQTLHTYYLNWRCTNMPWWGSKIIKRRYLEDDTPSEVRFHTPASRYVYNGGWHFGFLGGANAIRKKIRSYAHQEFLIPDVLNNIEERLRLKQDALGRLYQYEVVEIDDTYPEYIRNNLGRFKDWIYVP